MAITYDCKTRKPCEGCECKDVKLGKEPDSHTYCDICDPSGSRGVHCAFCGNSFVCGDEIIETSEGSMHSSCATKINEGA